MSDIYPTPIPCSLTAASLKTRPDCVSRPAVRILYPISCIASAARASGLGRPAHQLPGTLELSGPSTPSGAVPRPHSLLAPAIGPWKGHQKQKRLWYSCRERASTEQGVEKKGSVDSPMRDGIHQEPVNHQWPDNGERETINTARETAERPASHPPPRNRGASPRGGVWGNDIGDGACFCQAPEELLAELACLRLLWRTHLIYLSSSLRPSPPLPPRTNRL